MTGTSGALDALGVRLPAAGWAVLDALRERRFTGQVTLVGVPPTRLWSDQGRIYRAEPLGAPPIAARLVASGALTTGELARGIVRVGGRDHLGALFERVPTADRHAISLALTTMTEEALRAVAGQDIAAGTVEPYVFDPDGVHLWSAVPATLLAPPVTSWLPDNVPPTRPTPPADPARPTVTSVAPAAEPSHRPGAADPAAVAAAPAGAAATDIDWDRIPFLERLNAEPLDDDADAATESDSDDPSTRAATAAEGSTTGTAPRRANGHAATKRRAAHGSTNGDATAPAAPAEEQVADDDADTLFSVIWPDGDRRPAGSDVVAAPRAPNPLSELSISAHGRLFDDRFSDLDS